jgi:hypothetical protein
MSTLRRRLPRHDCFWHKADVQTALMDVCFQGNNGHDADVTRCLLMTHRRYDHAAGLFASKLIWINVSLRRRSIVISLAKWKPRRS